jgi:hypothetical protein
MLGQLPVVLGPERVIWLADQGPGALPRRRLTGDGRPSPRRSAGQGIGDDDASLPGSGRVVSFELREASTAV